MTEISITQERESHSRSENGQANILRKKVSKKFCSLNTVLEICINIHI